MAEKYIVRNGVKMPEKTALKVAEMRMKGYTYAVIAEKLGLAEHDVVEILNVNRE